MTSDTTTGGLPAAYVQRGLDAFGPISDPERGPGAEFDAASAAITAVFGSVKDRRQVFTALRAYRRYLGERSDRGLMRLMLEAARDWQPRKVWEIPDFTGRDFTTDTLTGDTADELERRAFGKAAEAFGHGRLQVDTTYTIRENTIPKQSQPGRLRTTGITVHELAPPDPDA